MRTDLLRDQDGAALVEAALVMPILLLLVFGILDLSFYAWRSMLAGKAVELGVRQAVVSASVAQGPGLTPSESDGYWDDLPLGTPCRQAGDDRSLCPTFDVRCDAAHGCTCTGTRCGFTLSRPNLRPILDRMRSMLPELGPEHVRLTYATNDLGYVGRPVPVPVDVSVALVGLTHRFGILGPLLGRDVPIAASAIRPGESLAAR